MYYAINGSPQSWKVDEELELEKWYQVEIKQSKGDGHGKAYKLNIFWYLMLDIFQFVFEIIIEGQSRERVVNEEDHGYDNVKIYFSIDDAHEGLGYLYIKEVQYSKGNGKVF